MSAPRCGLVNDTTWLVPSTLPHDNYLIATSAGPHRLVLRAAWIAAGHTEHENVITLDLKMVVSALPARATLNPIRYFSFST
jgi:hypothetical protein